MFPQLFTNLRSTSLELTGNTPRVAGGKKLPRKSRCIRNTLHTFKWHILQGSRNQTSSFSPLPRGKQIFMKNSPTGDFPGRKRSKGAAFSEHRPLIRLPWKRKRSLKHGNRDRSENENENEIDQRNTRHDILPRKEHQRSKSQRCKKGVGRNISGG